MKRFLFIGISLLIISSLSAQENFYWEVIDSTAKSKDQIYSATKVFIAETWRSAQDVIQNDDREGGTIIVKGLSVKEASVFTAQYRYVYRYTVTFQMKENKYRIFLKDVFCESADLTSSTADPYVEKIHPFDGDNCPPTGTFAAPGITKKKAIRMMAEFKLELQSIVDSYIEHMAKFEVVEDDW